MNPPPLTRWLTLLREAIEQGTLVKLTLGAPAGPAPTLRKLLIRPVTLREGERLAFVFRHTSRDITKNLLPDEAITRIEALLGGEFQTAHLFTSTAEAALGMRAATRPRLVLRPYRPATPPSTAHDRVRAQPIEPGTPWLHSLGVTTKEGLVCAGREAKFRQLNKFVELLGHLLAEAKLALAQPLRLVDMGCGKGYLTFAAWDWLRRQGWPAAEVLGVEARAELVATCRRVATEHAVAGLSFACGTIASQDVGGASVLVALHACDTATDDALAKGVEARAALILVAPCCHHELRPQLVPPSMLAGALRHGILRERQAEFVTDALRAALLEWAGYETKVFEFIATEHTTKNLMLAAIRRPQPGDREALARQARELAAFYGIRTQRLAAQLGFPLHGD
jgi:hypothetical protein